MVKPITFFLFLFILKSNVSFCQLPDIKQMEVAMLFLKGIRNGAIQNCWNLFDKKNIPSITKDKFESYVQKLRQDLSSYDDTSIFIMNKRKYVDDKLTNLYTFKTISKKEEFKEDIFLDLVFFDSSKFVAGINSRKILVPSPFWTTEPLTNLEKKFTALIDYTKYEILGISIFHLANSDDFTEIQIKYPLSNLTSESATKIATKFAQYLLENNYLSNAKMQAIEMQRKFLDDIRVVLVDVDKGGFWEIILKAADYKK